MRRGFDMLRVLDGLVLRQLLLKSGPGAGKLLHPSMLEEKVLNQVCLVMRLKLHGVPKTVAIW